MFRLPNSSIFSHNSFQSGLYRKPPIKQVLSKSPNELHCLQASGDRPNVTRRELGHRRWSPGGTFFPRRPGPRTPQSPPSARFSLLLFPHLRSPSCHVGALGPGSWIRSLRHPRCRECLFQSQGHVHANVPRSACLSWTSLRNSQLRYNVYNTCSLALLSHQPCTSTAHPESWTLCKPSSPRLPHLSKRSPRVAHTPNLRPPLNSITPHIHFISKPCWVQQHHPGLDIEIFCPKFPPHCSPGPTFGPLGLILGLETPKLFFESSWIMFLSCSKLQSPSVSQRKS